MKLLDMPKIGPRIERCGCGAPVEIARSGPNSPWFARCFDCLIVTAGHMTRLDAIKVWNRAMGRKP